MTVVDPRAGVAHAGRTVVVRGEHVELVGGAEELVVPDDARRVDGSGRFLIPGLWDMHVHMTQARRFGDLFVANGVTGVRDMFTSTRIGRLKEGFASGEKVGPRVVAAGRIVDGPNPYWPGSYVAEEPADAGPTLARLQRDGADFVKVYSKLPPDVFFAIAEEAGRLDLPFCGHVPRGVRAVDASNAGMRSFEHLIGIAVGCSSREDELVALTAKEATLREQGRAALESYDAEKARELYAVLAENRTWQCPTLVVLRSISHLDDEEFCDDERLDYLPASWRATWNPANDFRFDQNTAEDWELARQGYARSLELAGELHAAGVAVPRRDRLRQPVRVPRVQPARRARPPGRDRDDPGRGVADGDLEPGGVLRA